MAKKRGISILEDSIDDVVFEDAEVIPYDTGLLIRHDSRIKELEEQVKALLKRVHSLEARKKK